MANTTNNKTAALLGRTLDEGISQYLINRKAPSRKAGELDNRGTHFYLAMYWADALAAQNEDAELKTKFTQVAADLKENEEKILSEIAAAEGKATDMGGYYKPNKELVAKAMRPSTTLNAIIDAI
jgi:isocitrate dehydrogenase